jgi:hypothetical protein
MAQKLRNAVLFNECFVHVVGQWQNDTIPYHWALVERIEENPDIYRAVLKEHSRLCQYLLKTEGHFNVAVAQGQLLAPNDLIIGTFNCCEHGIHNPEFYRGLQELCMQFRHCENEKSIVASLNGTLIEVLCNELVLDKSLGFGEGSYGGYLLCARIKDEDWPWDIDQTDR